MPPRQRIPAEQQEARIRDPRRSGARYDEPVSLEKRLDRPIAEDGALEEPACQLEVNVSERRVSPNLPFESHSPIGFFAGVDHLLRFPNHPVTHTKWKPVRLHHDRLGCDPDLENQDLLAVNGDPLVSALDGWAQSSCRYREELSNRIVGVAVTRDAVIVVIDTEHERPSVSVRECRDVLGDQVAELSTVQRVGPRLFPVPQRLELEELAFVMRQESANLVSGEERPVGSAQSPIPFLRARTPSTHRFSSVMVGYKRRQGLRELPEPAIAADAVIHQKLLQCLSPVGAKENHRLMNPIQCCLPRSGRAVTPTARPAPLAAASTASSSSNNLRCLVRRGRAELAPPGAVSLPKR